MFANFCIVWLISLVLIPIGFATLPVESMGLMEYLLNGVFLGFLVILARIVWGIIPKSNTSLKVLKEFFLK